MLRDVLLFLLLHMGGEFELLERTWYFVGSSGNNAGSCWCPCLKVSSPLVHLLQELPTTTPPQQTRAQNTHRTSIPCFSPNTASCVLIPLSLSKGFRRCRLAVTSLSYFSILTIWFDSCWTENKVSTFLNCRSFYERSFSLQLSHLKSLIRKFS